jgi:hypothetical protein
MKRRNAVAALSMGARMRLTSYPPPFAMACMMAVSCCAYGGQQLAIPSRVTQPIHHSEFPKIDLRRMQKHPPSPLTHTNNQSRNRYASNN